jgi:cytoskeletal protein CcmA (bactofilin family)
MFNQKMSPERGDSPGGSAGSGDDPTGLGAAHGGVTRSARGGASTILAEGAKFNGNSTITGTYRIEGTAEGEIEATEMIVVGRTGNVQAKVSTPRAVLNGKFQGKLEASDRVELQAGSRVQCDIKTKNMVMEDGVQFQGNCRIGK